MKGRDITLNFKGDAKQLNQVINSVVADIKKVDTASKQVGAGGLGLNSSLAELSKLSSAAASGIAVVAAGALAVGTALFSAAKSASDYGSAIKDASDKTGLSAETLSTLKLAADQSGSSLESVSGSVTKFSKLIGSAAEGSKEARESLIRLGIEPKQAINDLDGSLDKVFKSIYEAKNPITATKLATEAFGKSGAELIPVLKQMNGDFSQFREEAERLGVVLSDADAQAADDFGDTLAALEAQTKGITNQFALGFMPQITEAMAEISGSLKDNKNVWREWGDSIGEQLLTITRGAKLFKAGIQDASGSYGVLGAALGFGNTPNVDRVLAENRAARDLPQQLENITVRGGDYMPLRKKRSGGDDEALKDFTQETLKMQAAESIQILENRYKREQAIRELNTRYTAAQEIAFLKESGAANSDYLNSQIARTTGFYNKQIALQSGNTAEIEKLTSERNRKLDDLNTELAADSARTQKQIQDLENRIYEERRQAAIEFGNLQIRESESFYDKQTFNLNRAIERQAGDSAAGFDALKAATQANYAELSALTKAQYEKQLENLSLTAEQRANIIKDGYLSQQNLAEQNRRAILDIEERQYRKSLDNIETAFGRRKDLLENFVKSTQFGIGLLSPEAFANNSSSLIQQALTGNDYQTLKRETQNALLRERAGLEQNRSSGQVDLSNAIDAGDKERVKTLSADLLILTQNLIDNQKSFENWGSLVQDNVLKVDLLVEKIKSGNGAIADFDTLGLESLKLRQEREGKVLDDEIESYAKRAKLASDAGNHVDAETFTYAKLTAERQKATKAIEDEAERTAYLAQTTAGLLDTLNKLRSGDKVSVRLVKDAADKNFARQQNSLAQENIALEQKYYTDAGYLSDQYKNRRLNNEREVFELRQELAQKGVFDQNESDAKVLNYLNSQIKSTSETFADFRIGIAGTFFDAVTSPFDALSKKLENLNPIVRGLAQTFLDLGRDIVKAFSQKIIMQLLGLGNTGGTGSGSGGGLLGGALGFIGNLLGNRGAGAGGGSTNLGGILTPNSIIRGGIGTGSGASLGGSSGLSSIFGSQGFGNNSGTYGVLGAGASILGGLIGGRTGGVISGAGSGALLGLSLGGPIGAGIGAIAGGLISLFGGDPKKKKDKKESLPKLNEGFIEAFKNLNQILVDSDSLKFNPPEEANTKADGIYADIAAGFGIVFESKKYRAEANKLIEQKKKEADVLRNQIKTSVLNAQTYGKDAAGLVPVFATGNYFGDDYAMASKATRPHGFIAGGRLGVDRHLGLFADGETIINHADRMNIITGAGYDVFKAHAAIPNYPKYADGNYFAPKGFTATTNQTTAAPQIVVQPQITIVVEGDIAAARVKEVMVDGLRDTGMKVKLAEAVGDGNYYTKGAALRSRRS